MKLSEWILLSREERIAHTDLSTPCEFDQRKGRGISRFVCFDYHEMENDVGDLRKARIGVNHLCECDTNNGQCVNPLHLYIGTKTENSFDMSEEKRGAGGRATKGRKNTWTDQETFVKAAKATAKLRYQSKIDGHIAPPGPLASRIRKQLGLPKGTKGLLDEWAVRLTPSTLGHDV